MSTTISSLLRLLALSSGLLSASGISATSEASANGYGSPNKYRKVSQSSESRTAAGAKTATRMRQSRPVRTSVKGLKLGRQRESQQQWDRIAGFDPAAVFEEGQAQGAVVTQDSRFGTETIEYGDASKRIVAKRNGGDEADFSVETTEKLSNGDVIESHISRETQRIFHRDLRNGKRQLLSKTVSVTNSATTTSPGGKISRVWYAKYDDKPTRYFQVVDPVGDAKIVIAGNDQVGPAPSVSVIANDLIRGTSYDFQQNARTGTWSIFTPRGGAPEKFTPTAATNELARKIESGEYGAVANLQGLAKFLRSSR